MRGLQADSLTFRVEALQGRLASDQGYYHLPRFGVLAALYDDQIAVVDSLINHRIADDLKDEVLADGASEKAGRHCESLIPGDRFDRFTGSDAAEKGHFSCTSWTALS